MKELIKAVVFSVLSYLLLYSCAVKGIEYYYLNIADVPVSATEK
jgi:hypothetical protein